MRLVRVTVGIDWKSTKSGKCERGASFFPTSAMSKANGTQNYNSDRHSISLSADLESSDALEDVEKRLHDECRTYLAKVSVNGRKESVSVKKEVKEETQPTPAPDSAFGIIADLCVE